MSALLSLSTDNAKELCLAKINAGTGMIGMYLYGAAIGMDFDVMNKNYLELFRLISSIFLHGGIFHLLCNMYSLYILGPQLESFFGKTKFVVIYIISGVIGNLLSMTFLQDGVVSVGASGAIFGLLGALLYFGYHYRVYLGGVIKSQILPILFINLAIGFLSAKYLV